MLHPDRRQSVIRFGLTAELQGLANPGLFHHDLKTRLEATIAASSLLKIVSTWNPWRPLFTRRNWAGK
ncbi:hypothetical protein AAFN60_06195 [Roseibacillus persicicus]|uniref:hypothetical protein n=1 Tax=Roseibacillus persicicus TaxID=454148 RepID=UPI00398B3B3B